MRANPAPSHQRARNFGATLHPGHDISTQKPWILSMVEGMEQQSQRESSSKTDKVVLDIRLQI
jgi:hypothetical protein